MCGHRCGGVILSKYEFPNTLIPKIPDWQLRFVNKSSRGGRTRPSTPEGDSMRRGRAIGYHWFSMYNSRRFPWTIKSDRRSRASDEGDVGDRRLPRFWSAEERTIRRRGCVGIPPCLTMSFPTCRCDSAPSGVNRLRTKDGVRSCHHLFPADCLPRRRRVRFRSAARSVKLKSIDQGTTRVVSRTVIALRLR